MNKVTYIKDYNPLSSDSFLIDTNVWIFLHYPLGNSNIPKQKLYSDFYNRAIGRSTFFTTSLIISEFINRYLRLDFELWKKGVATTMEYKRDYVGTSRYILAVEEVTILTEKLLSDCNLLPDNFHSISILSILSDFKKVDFNDAYISELAKKSNLKIVTDDKDFQKLSGLQILTGNR